MRPGIETNRKAGTPWLLAALYLGDVSRHVIPGKAGFSGRTSSGACDRTLLRGAEAQQACQEDSDIFRHGLISVFSVF